MRSILMAMAMLCTLAGCAFSEDVIDFPARSVTAAAIPSAGPVGLTVLDQRTSDRTRISSKMNGYGMSLAAIRSSRPVTDIVHDALTAEFTARGFTVGSAGPAITIGVKQFYNTYETGFWSGYANGQVSLAVTVTGSAGSSDFSRDYAGSNQNSVLLANGSNAADSLSDALHDAVQKMFDDPDFVSAVTRR